MIWIVLAILVSLGALAFTKKIPGRIILLTLIWWSYILFFRGWVSEIQLNKDFTIAKWQSIKTIAKNLGAIEKSFISEAKKTGANPKPGTYTLSGTYNAEKLIELFEKWPEKKITKVKVLEGWSIYDTDKDLADQWLIKAWEYISYVTNSDNISTLKETYKSIEWLNLQTLEWFLYPDTYFLDPNTSIVSWLVKAQLAQFDKLLVWEEKIWWADWKFSELISRINETYWLEIKKYDIIKLASIIQKEESNKSNIPTIAGIFFNRLKTNNSLGADITLCYAFKDPYSTCESHIKQYLEQDNEYNTRINKWLTPTPISNIDIATFSWVNKFEKTDYMFYLHWSDGQIYYAKTNAEHNINREKYLK